MCLGVHIRGSSFMEDIQTGIGNPDNYPGRICDSSLPGDPSLACEEGHDRWGNVCKNRVNSTNHIKICMFILRTYRKSMDFYRGKDYQQQEDELNEIMEQAQSKDVPNNISCHFQVLTSRHFLRPFLCLGHLVSSTHCSSCQVFLWSAPTHTYSWRNVKSIMKWSVIVVFLNHFF